MKVYAYERIEYTGFMSFTVEGHREIIDRYARLGYRYVGYLPVRLEGYGRIKEADLIFEKDEDDR